MTGAPVWLTTSAAAARAGVSLATVYRWIAAGLACGRRGKRLIRIRADDLDAWLMSVPRGSVPKTDADILQLARDFRRRER